MESAEKIAAAAIAAMVAEGLSLAEVADWCDGLDVREVTRLSKLASKAVDEVLARPWGPCVLRRNPVEVIQVPNRVVKPRRFDIIAQVNGVTWRRIQVEISPDEGSAGAHGEPLPAPSLAGFGLPTPDHLTGLAMRYQIAQKIHAVSEPHEPPTFHNDRARDVVDLLLLRDLIREAGNPILSDIKVAILDIFAARAGDAAVLGYPKRRWPVRILVATS